MIGTKSLVNIVQLGWTHYHHLHFILPSVEVIMSLFYHSFGVEGKIVVEKRQTNEMQPSSRMV